ncbi:MAG: ATP synthase subunit I [Nitrospirae bacterium]|uniref:ATP synthase subunit I n=1 Tax=Candidatus Magnetobacterium casense TaxID=1455061 RepID=UPI000590D16A|nr:ATP synthase subunit I [Candidatus Magnetobacterium casensis]MBF0338432.1 ATP synthase subunit I [Nitrospirota bacterium]
MNKHYLSYAVLLLAVALIIASYLSGKRLPVSIAIGWFIGLVNYSLLRWSTKRFIMGQRNQFTLVSLNMVRLGLVFIAVIILLSLKMANAIGLFVGLVLINVVIMIDGYINRSELG